MQREIAAILGEKKAVLRQTDRADFGRDPAFSKCYYPKERVDSLCLVLEMEERTELIRIGGEHAWPAILTGFRSEAVQTGMDTRRDRGLRRRT